ncbi:glycoside hydrolase family 97 catalytic domain-containing protein [Anaeromassilibacillus senegalensis]|uniref:glycoside hydrolase family 97 catalytic domain-containing protein n=1 Tax=Anaeromassilibacillus senegalensis TaxID=1673717 RepID=UPI000682E879|nr:glycoside hydrolase family 97 catalytic domain-containing protein [Anaeromassilibacillus senegalensis]
MRKKAWNSALSLVLVFTLVFTSWIPAFARVNTEEAGNPDGDTTSIYLSDMEWTSAHDGWWLVRKDRDVNVQKIVLKDADGTDVPFEKGLGTSGNAEIIYDLTGYGALRFQAQIAIQSDWGTTTFTLQADGKEIYTKSLNSSKGITPIDVIIPEGTTVLRMATSGYPNAVWADAKLVCDRSVLDRLQTIAIQPEEPSVAVGAAAGMVLSAYSNGKEKIDLTEDQCTFSSSNPEVAAVNEKTGKVTGISDGIATITCEAVDGDIVCTASCEIIVGAGQEGQTWSVSSPDGTVSALFFMNDKGAVRFVSSYEGKTVVASSPTGLVTSEGDFRDGLTFAAREDKTVTDLYDLIGAKVDQVSATANQMTLHFTKDGVSYSIVVRAYDDGMAFRYVIETEDGAELHISEENTGFQLASGSVAQAMDYEYANESVAQEHEAHKLRGGYCMPLLYETSDGAWALLSEADLNATYCGAQLQGDGTGLLRVTFTPEQEDDVVTEAPFTSPWRFAVIGTPKTIVENTMAETLSEDCQVEDTSWIQPGTVDWTWLNGDLRHTDPNVNFETDAFEIYKKYVDFAVEMGWQYQLLDEGWQKKAPRGSDYIYEGYYDWTDDLVQYANEKGIGLIVWANSSDLDTPEKQERITEWAKMGFKGIKPDFFDSQSQDTILQIERLMKKTAENHMLLNLHGAGKPTGERRTWPQVISREAVFGAEQYDFIPDNVSARHNCTLPYTRNAVGPMDYTPMASFGVSGDHRQFTLAHMAALPVIFEAGVSCMADTPEVYRAHPGYEHYFKGMPSAWEKSLLVDGVPCEYVNIARSSGDDWYQGIICDGARTAEFDLDFLGEGTYTAYIFLDGEDPMEVVDTETQTVTKNDSLSIPLAETGGAAIHYVKTEKSPEWDSSATYQILSSLKDAGIETYGGATAPGTVVDLWWNYQGDALYWRLIPDANMEYYRIQPKNTTATVLMPTDFKAEAGVKLTVGNINNADNSQWWKIVPASNDTFQILNKKAETPLYIALDGDGTSDGTPAVLASGSAKTSFWKLPKTAAPEPEPQEPVAEVTAAQTLLAVGKSTSVSVSATDRFGNTITDYTIESSNPSVLEITKTGTGITAAAKSNGTASILFRAELDDGSILRAHAQVVVGTEPVEGSIFEVKAPNSDVAALVAYDRAAGTVSYLACKDDELFAGVSPTGLATNLGDFRSGLVLGDVSEQIANDSYDLIGGKVKHIDTSYREVTFPFTKDGVAYSMIFRAYDDGIALRYAIDGENDLTITEEFTGLQLPQEYQQFWGQSSGDNSSVANEWPHRKQSGRANIEGSVYNVPLLYQTKDGSYGLFSEADLMTGTYCGSVIQGGKGKMFHVKFAPEQAAEGPVVTTAPFTSPWRFLVMGDLAAIMDNTMPENLSPDSVIEDTSWVEPGVSNWSWLNGDLRHDQIPADKFETEGLRIYKEYIDFAAEMGWQYQLLDEGWMIPYNRTQDKENVPGYDPNAPAGQRYLGYYSWTEEVVAYAKSKGIKLLVWVHKNDIVTEKQRERIAYWAELGIAGIKPDFFDSATQSMMQLYDNLLKLTAENHMIINLHGTVKPAGERRTYPNALTREAVGGAEGYAVSDWRDVNDYGGGSRPWGGDLTSANNCVIPFTRGAVGPLDYTPMASFGALNNVRFGPLDPDTGKPQEFDNPPLFTLAHMYALPIIYESGIQCLADKPSVYQSIPHYEKYWSAMPAEWDESKLVDGQVGELVEMARRNGDDWYLGVICAYKENKPVDIDLDFLGEGTYTAYIYRDNPDNPLDLEEPLNGLIAETKTVTRDDVLTLELAGLETPVLEYTFKQADGSTITAHSRKGMTTSGGAAIRFEKTSGAKALEVTYSGKQASLFVNDEEQKLANLTGSYKAELTPDGKTTLTFIPAVEGREFAGVSVNGEAQEDFTADSYTMTIDGLPTAAKYDLAFTVVNKQILRTVLTAAETLNGGKEYLEAVPSVQKKFDAALKNAQEIEKQLNASQKAIDGTWKDLLHVIQFLSFAKGDKTALEEALTAAGMLDEELYTSASWQAFQKACEAAQAVYDDEDAMDKEIQEACASLNQAMEDLEDKADWSELLSLMEKAEEIEAVLDTAYLETGRDAFQKALDEARAMEENASQKEVNQMTEKLTLAMAGLRKIPNRDELNDLIAEMEQVSLNGYTKASAATFAQALSDLKAAAADETADDETLATAYYNAVDAKDNLEKAEIPVKPDRKPSGGKGSSTSSSHTYGAAGTAVVNAAQSVSTQGAYVVSDTTVNFTLKRGSAYCFKMTVQGGANLTPSFTVGNGGVLKTQFVAKISNDCYYRVWAVGTPGQSTGVYTQLPNGEPQKHCAITIA